MIYEIITNLWHWVWIAQLILFWHLVAWGSLQIKWGALPLAIAIVLFGDFIAQISTMIAFVVLFGASGNSIPDERFILYVLPLFFTCGQLLLAALLHLGIGKQLHDQAAA